MSENPLHIDLSRFKILLVDSDPSYRKVTARQLSEIGFQVTMTNSSHRAKKIVKDDHIDLIITELQIPQESGLELIKWVRRVYDTSFRKYNPLPCLIMTSFSHLLEKEDLKDLHHDGCLFKPVKQAELEEAVLVALKLKDKLNQPKMIEDLAEEKTATAPEIEPHQRDYCQVLLSDFNSTPILEVDLFIQLSKDKFVRIAKRGEQLSDIQFKRYYEKGIKHLYIKKIDFKKVVNFNLKLTKAITQTDKIPLEKKKRFLAKTGEIILEHTFVNGVNQETFEDAKDYLCTSINTLLEDDDVFTLLEALNDHSNSLYAHSLGVSIYSIMIAKKMGWNSGSNLFKLGYGALMHDIGKKDFDPELLQKPSSELSFEEKTLLETHPERGKEILENLRSVPSEVVSIAFEHHENAIGQGYPRFLKKNRISPMARIVSVADEFCKFAIKTPDTPSPNATRALHMLDQYKHKLLDNDALMALRSIVKKQTEKAS